MTILEFADQHIVFAFIALCLGAWVISLPFDVLSTWARRKNVSVKVAKGATPEAIKAAGDVLEQNGKP